MNFLELVREADRWDCETCHGETEESGDDYCPDCSGLGWEMPDFEWLIREILEKGEVSFKLTRFSDNLWQVGTQTGETLIEAVYRFYLDVVPLEV